MMHHGVCSIACYCKDIVFYTVCMYYIIFRLYAASYIILYYILIFYTIYNIYIYIYIHNSQHRHKLLSSHYLGTCGDGGVFPNVGRDAHSP